MKSTQAGLVALFLSTEGVPEREGHLNSCADTAVFFATRASIAVGEALAWDPPKSAFSDCCICAGLSHPISETYCDPSSVTP